MDDFAYLCKCVFIYYNMKRQDEFEQKLDKLIDEFSDVEYEDIADSLEYYASMYNQKANAEV